MKLSGWVYLVVGVSIAMVALSYSFFQHFLPDMVDATLRTTYAKLLEKEAEREGAAQVKIDHARRDVAEMAAEWKQLSADKTPSNALSEGGINLSKNPYDLTVDAPKYRNSLQRAINEQMRYGGVTVLSGGSRVPQPPGDAASLMNSFFNYDRLPFPVVIIDVGAITVRGTFAQIKANMEGWSQMPNYLAVADGLSLTGTAPELTGTYSVSIIGFMRGGVTGPMGGVASLPDSGEEAGDSEDIAQRPGSGNVGGIER
ncbi:MAG: hypothetical protein IH944_09020 [Armatimonadetes bacterium]|nr:hypothetical protein [Armatimonadota bacterium]